MSFRLAVWIYLVFFSSDILAQKIPKDWFEKDPRNDSLAGISLDNAYLLLKGMVSKPVIVAVIDNGVDTEHEDLKNKIWTNTKEVPDNGIDDDHNGYIDDIHGWNFRGTKDGTVVENEQAGATQVYAAWKKKYDNVDTSKLAPNEKRKWNIYAKAKKQFIEKISGQDSSEFKFSYNLNFNSSKLIANDSDDPNNHSYGSPHYRLSSNLSHGTHVAGIIGAERNNHKGINGIADNVLIMPILATTSGGDERDKDVGNAIRYAVDNGAKVINMSFSKMFSSDKNIVDKAVEYAQKKNILIIHAAGNDGMNIDSAKNYHYPIAIFEDDKRATNFITVGWNRPLFDYRLAHPNSDYGKKNVDFFAPGSDIYSTVPGNDYGFKSGSSMSAPVASGVAALLLSYFPTLSAEQLRDILLKSVFTPDQTVNRPKTKIQVPFNTLSASGGIVNAYNAVKLAMKK